MSHALFCQNLCKHMSLNTVNKAFVTCNLYWRQHWEWAKYLINSRAQIFRHHTDQFHQSDCRNKANAAACTTLLATLGIFTRTMHRVSTATVISRFLSNVRHNPARSVHILNRSNVLKLGSIRKTGHGKHGTPNFSSHSSIVVHGHGG
jgi:hypothetical protein